MRTTLDIADGLMNALMARYPAASKTEAIVCGTVLAELVGDVPADRRRQRT